MSRADGQADLCLVVPPFATVDYPVLGVSILARGCAERGLSVKQIYGNLRLAARIGYSTYERIGRAPLSAMAGERVFIPHAYDEAQRTQLGALTPLDDDVQRAVDLCAAEIEPFVHELTGEILACRPRVVGFTSSFQQNLAAIALARAVRRAAPDVVLVMGGANVAMPMGEALAELFPWIDHFFAGEADIEFPAFCERLLAGSAGAEPQLVVCEPIRDMRRVNGPDFSGYFDTLRPLQAAGALPSHLPVTLPLESSRGCWWGAKNHCTFCGLNFDTMDFRRRAPDRVFAEVEEAVERWGAAHVSFTDNIMPLDFVDTLFPALEGLHGHPKLFYEVKANLSDAQLDAMAKGGVDSIQPGIESLSTHTLTLMRKGVSALQNVALLRACRARGIRVTWSHLYGFPGELAEDYESVLRLLPKIEHLQPPGNAQRISIDRYSPYHRDAERLGIGRIRPFQNYGGLYPADARQADLAYHFTGDYSTAFIDDAPLVERFAAAIEVWRRRWREAQPALQLIDRGGSSVVVADTRAIAQAPLATLSRAAAEALLYFEKGRNARGDHPAAVAAEIAALLERDFLVEHEGKLLSLVTRPPATAAALPAEQREARCAA